MGGEGLGGERGGVQEEGHPSSLRKKTIKHRPGPAQPYFYTRCLHQIHTLLP